MEADTRDMRDPTALGEALLNPRSRVAASHHHGVTRATASQCYDYGVRRGQMNTPLYDSSETSVRSSVLLRQQELRDRAAQGDRYAISMLNGEAFTEPSDGI